MFCKLTNLKSLIEQEINLKKLDLAFSARHIGVKIIFLQSATAYLFRKTQRKSTVLMLLNGLQQSSCHLFMKRA